MLSMAREPLRTLDGARARWGDLVGLRLGKLRLYVVSRPDWVEHILVRNARNYTRKTGLVSLTEEVLGVGLITSEGDVWKRLRRIQQPSFHKDQVRGYAEVVKGAATKVIAQWDALAAERRPAEITWEMLKATLQIVGEALLGADLSPKAQELVDAFAVCQRYFIRTVRAPRWIPTPANRGFERALRTLDTVAYQVIAACRARGAADQSLVGRLIQARDDKTGEALTDREVRDSIVTHFGAGHDTTAMTLAWTFIFLALHPELEGPIREEVAEVVGDRLATPDDLPRLKKTTRLLNEVMRLRPALWSFTRKAIAADRLGDHAIPAGAVFMVSPYLIHRHPEHWPDPERFDPSRFEDAAVDARPRGAFLPFGLGPRMCIGQSFAMQEMLLFLAALVTRYRLRLVEGDPVPPVARYTLSPPDETMMTIERV
jgi:cytochrome P450